MPHYETEDKLSLYYEIHGSGKENILFITGLHTTLMTWKHQIRYFEALDYQICILDNRGHGRSGKPFGLYTVRQMAKEAFELVEKHLKWSSFHLVGHSMGGMIAQELALICSSRLNSLCLYATHSGAFFIPPMEGIIKAATMHVTSFYDVSKLAKNLIAIQFPKEYLEEKDKMQISNLEKHYKDMIEEEFLVGEGTPDLVGLLGQIAAIGTHKVTKKRLLKLKESSKKYNFPIMIITGTDDLLVRPVNSKYLSSVLKCKLLFIKGAGHMVHLERPEVFNRALLDHLNSNQISKL